MHSQLMDSLTAHPLCHFLADNHTWPKPVKTKTWVPRNPIKTPEYEKKVSRNPIKTTEYEKMSFPQPQNDRQGAGGKLPPGAVFGPALQLATDARH